MPKLFILPPSCLGTSRSVRARVWFAAAAISAASCILTQAPAEAKAIVQGTADAISLEADNSSVAELLAALSDSFAVRYSSSARLERHLTGTYRGSLERVVKRILEGYDFVVKNDKNGLVITVLAVGDGPSVMPASTAERPVEAAPAQRNAAMKVAELSQPQPAEPQAISPSPDVKLAQAGTSLPMPPAGTSAGGPAPVPTVGPGTAAAPMPTPLTPGQVPFPAPNPVPSGIAPPVPPASQAAAPSGESVPPAGAPGASAPAVPKAP